MITVPDKTISVLVYPEYEGKISKERLDGILSPPEKMREWFTPHFYRCLPLTIANTYGFVFRTEYEMFVEWDGNDKQESIVIEYPKETADLFPRTTSHFGSGILTFEYPLLLNTPPGVNLMIMNPPNYILAGMSTMTAIVETDNLRNSFTINLKIEIPRVRIHIPKGMPIAAIVPVPRYFGDSFNLKMADELFTDDQIVEEYNALEDFLILRQEVEPTMKNGVNQLYMKGVDVYGNKFPDHQSPNKKPMA